MKRKTRNQLFYCLAFLAIGWLSYFFGKAGPVGFIMMVIFVGPLALLWSKQNLSICGKIGRTFICLALIALPVAVLMPALGKMLEVGRTPDHKQVVKWIENKVQKGEPIPNTIDMHLFVFQRTNIFYYNRDAWEKPQRILLYSKIDYPLTNDTKYYVTYGNGKGHWTQGLDELAAEFGCIGFNILSSEIIPAKKEN